MPIIRKYLAEKFLFLFFIRSNKRILSELNELSKFKFNTLEENLKIQRKKLKDILLYSWQNVLYYNKILEEANNLISGFDNSS